MWLMPVVAVAPCQCFSPGSNQTTSPGRISSTEPPRRCTQPRPDVTMRVWPSGCGVPGGACARLEGDMRAANARGLLGLDQGIDAHAAGEVIRGSLSGGP